MDVNTTVIRARVERQRAQRVNEILGALGLKPGDAVNLFFAQIEAHQGLPFAVRLDGYDYARSEYGLTREETDRLSRRMKTSVARARRTGALREVKTAEDLG
jgi:addiction module RelB/DinJ family antitoxin